MNSFKSGEDKLIKKNLRDSRIMGLLNCLLENPNLNMSKIAEKNWYASKDSLGDKEKFREKCYYLRVHSCC